MIWSGLQYGATWSRRERQFLASLFSVGARHAVPGKRTWRSFAICCEPTVRHTVPLTETGVCRTGHGMPCPYKTSEGDWPRRRVRYS